jgi:hypothetical protein
MKGKPQAASMICPCCGQERAVALTECTACGARQVGTPLLPPDVLLPKLGPAVAALTCAILVVLAFLVSWVFGNDMRVGRVALIWAIGDATKFTHELLQADPKLLSYRIFSYDAYRLAFTLSVVLIPLSLLGLGLGRRALRLARNHPAHFGGLRLARIALALSATLFITFSAATISLIPNALARGKAKHLAATRAKMYELHYHALQKYHEEYGSYPQDLLDISRVNVEGVPQADYWDNNFNYQPVSVIASNGRAISFSNYKLVSAGPDGKLGTKDDITMIDGIIVEEQQNAELPPAISIPEKTRRQ